jgi:signal transduction histidine kinase
MMRSSALSLALGYVVLGIAALVLFAAPLYYAWQVTIQDGRSEILQADAQRLTDVYRRDGGEGLKAFIDARVNMQIAGDRILMLTDDSLRPLAGNLKTWPARLPLAPGNYRVQVDTGERGVQESLIHVARLGDFTLLVGRDNRLFAPLERRFWYGLGAAIAVLSIAGLMVGLITRRALMSRVHSIRQTISAIIHGDLKHRLPVARSNDELDTLAHTINGMLEQIEQLVHGVRNVSNSIAHDLRTPLAELRSRLEELTLMRPPPETAFAEIDGAVADVDRVIRIFDALLRLAEMDSGLRRSGFVTLDLADLAAAAVEFYAPAAELKDIKLRLDASSPVEVSGDPVLLAQALSNLIDNALKYAPEGGAIDVAIRRRVNGAAEISVTDDGPGIRDSEKAKVFERFYRGDASRGTPGVGLGLSLVQAVAKLHGSTLELLDRDPGLAVTMTLPEISTAMPAELAAAPAAASRISAATGSAPPEPASSGLAASGSAPSGLASPGPIAHGTPSADSYAHAPLKRL